MVEQQLPDKIIITLSIQDAITLNDELINDRYNNRPVLQAFLDTLWNEIKEQYMKYESPEHYNMLKELSERRDAE